MLSLQAVGRKDVVAGDADLVMVHFLPMVFFLLSAVAEEAFAGDLCFCSVHPAEEAVKNEDPANLAKGRFLQKALCPEVVSAEAIVVAAVVVKVFRPDHPAYLAHQDRKDGHLVVDAGLDQTVRAAAPVHFHHGDYFWTEAGCGPFCHFFRGSSE